METSGRDWLGFLGVGSTTLGRGPGPCCARVPLAIEQSRRPVNSPGTWSPGPSASVWLEQHWACTLDCSMARGQVPDSPQGRTPHTKKKGISQRAQEEGCIYYLHLHLCLSCPVLVLVPEPVLEAMPRSVVCVRAFSALLVSALFFSLFLYLALTAAGVERFIGLRLRPGQV